MRKRNNTYINRTVHLLAGLLLLATAVITAKPQTVSAAPFTCDSNFYQLINGSLTRLNPDTGQYVAIGSTGSLNTNAAGYNAEDDYIYAWQRVDGFGGGTPGLVRIEDDGTTTPLGLPSGMVDASFTSGDFDTSGNLYIYFNGTSLWRIDVSAMTGTLITLSTAVGSVNDIVFINGFLYGLDSTTLYRIDPTTGNVTTAPISIQPDPGNPSSVYGAGWGADNSKLFFSRNSDGMIFEITDLASVSPTATPVLSGQIATGNDGAACVLGRSPIPPLFAADDTNTTTANTPVSGNVLPNDSGRQITVTDYTQPSNGTVVVNADGSYTYTPNNGFTGQDNFTYTITDEYGETRVATVTITVTAMPSTPATLATTGASVTVVLGVALTLLIVSGVLYRRQYQ